MTAVVGLYLGKSPHSRFFTNVVSIGTIHKKRQLAGGFSPYSAGIDFSLQNLTSVDVRF